MKPLNVLCPEMRLLDDGYYSPFSGVYKHYKYNYGGVSRLGMQIEYPLTSGNSEFGIWYRRIDRQISGAEI